MEANDFIWRAPDNWSYAHSNVAFREQMGPDHVTQLDGKPHRARRQHLQPALSTEVSRRQIPTMDGIIARELAAVAGQPVDFTRLLAQTIIRMSGKTFVQCELSEDSIEKMDVWEHDFIFGIAGLGCGTFTITARSTGGTSGRYSRSSGASWTHGRP